MKSKKGQIMVEAVVALTFLSVGTLGIFSLLSSSLSLNRISGDQYVAVNLASEGIEIVRNILDINLMQEEPWNAGVGDGDKEADFNDLILREALNEPLRFDQATGLYSYDAGVNTKFRRTITIRNIDENQIKITSAVRWRDRNATNYEVVLENHTFNWR